MPRGDNRLFVINIDSFIIIGPNKITSSSSFCISELHVNGHQELNALCSIDEMKQMPNKRSPFFLMTDPHPVISIDLGSWSLKAGVSTEETPRFVVPSFFPADDPHYPINQKPGDDSVAANMISKGLIDNKDRFTYVMEQIMPQLQKDLGRPYVIINDNPDTDLKNMKYIAQYMFETWSTYTLSMKPTPLAYLQACGTPNGVCIDIGHGLSTITTISNTYTLGFAATNSILAGQSIFNFIAHRHCDTFPQLSFKQIDMITDIQHHLHTSPTPYTPDVEDDSAPIEKIDLTKLIAPELLHVPSWFQFDYLPDGEEDIDENGIQIPTEIAQLTEANSVVKTVAGVIKQAGIMLQIPMWKNIHIIGGTSAMEGFEARFLNEASSYIEENADTLFTPRVFMDECPQIAGWKAMAQMEVEPSIPYCMDLFHWAEDGENCASVFRPRSDRDIKKEE